MGSKRSPAALKVAKTDRKRKRSISAMDEGGLSVLADAAALAASEKDEVEESTSEEAKSDEDKETTPTASDSISADDEPPAKRPKITLTVKKSATVKARVSTKAIEAPTKITLIIPRISGSTSRKTVAPTDDFDFTILPLIYETLGCTDIARKPVLSWKLSTATAKTLPTDLGNDEDWEACVEDVQAQQKKKKELVPVNIIIPENYMHSLATRLKKPSGASAKKNSKSKPQLLDLDNDDEETGNLSDDEGTGTTLMEKEQTFFDQLSRKHSTCQACGPTKRCKIGFNGVHVHLTHNQLRAWSQALASGTHGVTLNTAPRGELFQPFHKTTIGATINDPWAIASSPTLPSASASSAGNDGLLGLLVGHLLGQNPLHASTSTVARSQTPHRQPIPMTSSPAPAFFTFYPDIKDFLSGLTMSAPQRAHALSTLSEELLAKDMFNIDEIQDFTKEDLMQGYGLSEGNARFVVREVENEMKRIRKGKRRAQRD